jgi:hypothetical protein
MPRIEVARRKSDDLSARADYGLGFERQSRRNFTAQLLAAHGLADHERTRCADIDGIEVLQLFGQRSGPKGLMTADVDAS